MLKEIWPRLTESEQDELIGSICTLLQAPDSKLTIQYIAKVINVRPKTLLRATPEGLGRHLRMAIWKLAPQQRGELFCRAYLSRFPAEVAGLYAALGVPVDDQEPTKLLESARESSPPAKQFLGAIESLSGESTRVHPLVMCAAISEGGIPIWRPGARKAVEEALLDFRRPERPGESRENHAASSQNPPVDTSPGSPAQDPEDSPAENETIDAAVFSALDRLLIRTVIDALDEQEGALSVDEASDVIQEILDLNSSRTISRFHEGFLDALQGRVAADRSAATNEMRDCWYLVGFYFGRLRLTDAVSVLGEVKALPTQRRALLVGPDAPDPSLELLPHLLRAAFSAPDVDFVLEAIRKPPKAELELVGEALDWIEGFLLDVDIALAMRALGRVEEWLVAYEQDSVDRAIAESLCGRLRLTLHRMRGEFAAVELLADNMSEGKVFLPPPLWARVPGERALAAMGIRDIASIVLPDPTDQESFLLSVDRHLGKHSADDLWRHWPPTAVLSAMPALLDSGRNQDEAIRLLEYAVTMMSDSPAAAWRESGLLDRARVYLSVLELENARVSELGRPVARVLDLLRDKIEIPSDLISRILDASVAGDAPGILQLANLLLHVSPRDVLLTVDNEEMVRQSPDYRRGLRTRLELGDLGIQPEAKIRILVQAARGARDSNNADLDFARWALDEAASIAENDTKAAAILIDVIDESSNWNGIIEEEEADTLQMRLLDRTGRSGLYQGILLRRINIAVADRRLAIARDLLDIWDEKGFDDQALLSRRRQIEAMEEEARQSRRDPSKEDSKWYQDLVLLFVGGNETQAQYRDDLIEQFKRKFPGLRIEFHFPGWSANWGGKADQVKRELQDADAMVLMPMVRTMFGRAVRRAAGEARVPWIPCTGTGRASLERALLEGVSVAVEQRKRVARDDAAAQPE